MKTLCNQCGKAPKYPRSGYCRECRKEHDKRYYEERKESIRSKLRERVYGLSEEDYQALIKKQDGRCVICRSQDPGRSKYWNVDHCHDSGKVRGLLCTTCNTGLGHFKDDAELLKAAVKYLEASS